MRKTIKYVSGAVAVIVVLICSIRIEKLDEYKTGKNLTNFSSADYASELWKIKCRHLLMKLPKFYP